MRPYRSVRCRGRHRRRSDFTCRRTGQAAATPQQGAAPPQVAFEYSDAYRLRAKIHKVASFTMLPLTATEGFLDSRSIQIPSSGKRDAHLPSPPASARCSRSTSVTGVWNLVEARKDPVHRGGGSPMVCAARRGCGLSRHGGARARG